MEKYTSLKSKYFYDKTPDKKEYNSFLTSRLTNELTIFSGLKMNPFDSKKECRLKNEYEIFFMPTLEISLIKEEIFKNSQIISEKMTNLPSVAADQLFFNTLIFELQSTNDIEGVHSSRQELSEVINNVITKSSGPNMRFEGLVQQYLNLRKQKFNSIKNIDEFRKIWDILVGNEEKDDVPDGLLFRTEPESIYDDHDRLIHVGDFTEEQITQNLNHLIKEMNDSSIPSLEKCFIAHYYYEYIHPFYDGNGRTGRYIACSYLARKLDIMTAVSFSYAISFDKNRYYKPFMDMSKFYNHGDATMFILEMLKILLNGQERFIGRINDGINLLELANDTIKELDVKDNEKAIIYILFQKHIFGDYAPELTDNAIREVLNISSYKMRNHTSTLEKKGLIKVVKEKPKVHILADILLNDIEPLR